MRILLLESAPGVGEETAASLAAEGHDLVRCIEPDGTAFPCRELEAPGSCPLRARPTVDCAVVVHAGRPDETTASEAGVSCAIRHQVPVVARHDGPSSPFTGWSIPVGDTGVTAACNVAVAAARAHETRPLVAEVERFLERVGLDPTGAGVELHRDDDRTRVIVAVPPGAGIHAQAIATRVHARYSEGHHPESESVTDIEVHERTPTS